jgi:CHAT domain-containing protein
VTSLLRLFLILLLFSSCLFYSLSQKKDSADYRLALSQFRTAQKIYDEATALNNSDEYDEKTEAELNRKALELFTSAFHKMKADGAYDSLRFFSAFHIGELEHYFDRLQDALNGYKQAIAIQQNSQFPDSVLFKPYLYSGIIYYNQNKYDSAIASFKKAEAVQSQYGYALEESERLYNTFGVLFYEKGDYRQAKNYFLKALDVLPASHPYYKQLFTNYRINLAQIYFKLEDYDESNKIYQQLLASNAPNRNESLHNLGLINLYLGAPEKALDYFRKVDYRTGKQIWLYENIGEAFLNLEQFDSAGYYFQKAVNFFSNPGNNGDPVAFGLTLKSIGELELHFDHPFLALANYQKAIQRFYPAFSDTSFRSNPQQFSGVFSYINLFNTLVAKAEAFDVLYQKSSDTAWAIQELQAYQSAFKLIDYVGRTYNSDEARLFLNKIKYVVHIKPIDIAYELYTKTKQKRFLDALYIFDQQNKASILALKTQSAEQASEKDSSLLSRESGLRSEITRLSLKASQTTDSDALAEFNTAIRDHEIELGRIQEKLSNSTVATKIPSVEFLQTQLLDKRTALFSFHLSDDRLTTLVITQKKFSCQQQKLFPGFRTYLANYVEALKNISANDTLITSSKKIRSFLFDNFDLEKTDRLIIIPDDELNYLSFESLQDTAGTYLIQHFSVQYQYSTGLLKKEMPDFSNHQTLAFAPFATTGFKDSLENFERLPNSLLEIDDLDGKRFIGSEATKKNFIANLAKYKVLHLATHAVVNNTEDNLSFISFYPSQKENRSAFLLYAEEIYDLPLNHTDLVILSACETASGNLVKGEGVMSLSRAFAYAGCSNIITSLWNANDFSTAYLTNRVHLYLDKNYSIDEALRNAKLDYLNDKSINPHLKQPFYWSHLIFVGNYSASKGFNYWWLVLAGLVAAILSFIFIKKPHKK